MQKYCYATFADSEDYLKEALGLAFSLQKTKTKYPLYILIPDRFFENEILTKYQKILPDNCFLKAVIPLLFDVKLSTTFNSTINKFQILTLTEYEAVCFLDADLYILNNIDYCFSSKLSPELETYGFILKPDLNLFALILLHLNLGFKSDGEFFAYLQNNSFLPDNVVWKRIKHYDYLHDRSINKFFTNFTYEKIKTIQNDPYLIYELKSHIEKNIVYDKDNTCESYQLNYLNKLLENITNNYVDF